MLVALLSQLIVIILSSSFFCAACSLPHHISPFLSNLFFLLFLLLLPSLHSSSCSSFSFLFSLSLFSSSSFKFLNKMAYVPDFTCQLLEFMLAAAAFAIHGFARDVVMTDLHIGFGYCRLWILLWRCDVCQVKWCNPHVSIRIEIHYEMNCTANESNQVL